MKTIHGHLYMHMDSRGGSMLIQGTKEQTDEKYLRSFAYDEEEMKEFGQNILNEDYETPVTLHVPDDFDTETVRDLDLNFNEKGGAPITKGPNTQPINWEDLNSNPEEYLDHDDQPVEIEYVPKGQQPQILKQWSWPRWDDDAFALIFCSETQEID